MAKGVTLADIAAKVGVSNVAVSKALSGQPGAGSNRWQSRWGISPALQADPRLQPQGTSV